MHRLKLYFYRATYSKYTCKKLAAKLSNWQEKTHNWKYKNPTKERWKRKDKVDIRNKLQLTISITISTDYAIWFGAFVTTIYSLSNKSEVTFWKRVSQNRKEKSRRRQSSFTHCHHEKYYAKHGYLTSAVFHRNIPRNVLNLKILN